MGQASTACGCSCPPEVERVIAARIGIGAPSEPSKPPRPPAHPYAAEASPGRHAAMVTATCATAASPGRLPEPVADVSAPVVTASPGRATGTPVRSPGRISERSESKARAREAARSADAIAPRCRSVCAIGFKCRRRAETDHLSREAHPFDPDYADACEAAGIAPEEPCLRGLFDWVDLDSSGKVSRQELEKSLPLISRLWGDDVQITTKAWERLDEDQNGLVNFSEFAEWAGPRLGLPLGVKHLFNEGKRACGIMGCPCQDFCDDSWLARSSAPRKRRRSKEKSAGFATTSRGLSRLQICRCGHKSSSHFCALPPGFEVPYPEYWAERSGCEVNTLVPVDSKTLELFQDLFDSTHVDICTEERRRYNPSSPDVPQRFSVVSAWRCENSKYWREYVVRRAELCKDRLESGPSDDFVQYSDVKSTKAWIGCAGDQYNRLQAKCNEWYLFYGSSPKVAKDICSGDFKFCLADCARTGGIYGRGLTFAESITKADETSKANKEGEYCVLLSRVLGGHVRYVDDAEPDPEDLLNSCVEGSYDCILGDQEKLKGTFRQFVIYDSENLYADYIIHYRREMKSKRPSAMDSSASLPVGKLKSDDGSDSMPVGKIRSDSKAKSPPASGRSSMSRHSRTSPRPSGCETKSAPISQFSRPSSRSASPAPASPKLKFTHSSVCFLGFKCPRRRDKEHLRKEAHPLDKEYAEMCESMEVDPEPLTLRGLFDWVDLDNSKKVSRKELQKALPLLSELSGGELKISTKAWERLDEDGNGCVNFSEFAEWAGPRLGLPLGVRHLFAPGKQACGILGCPCENFIDRDAASHREVKTRRRSSTDGESGRRAGIKMTLRIEYRLKVCSCGHKQSAHQQPTAETALEVPYPSYWDEQTGSREVNDLVPVSGTMLVLFQELFDVTYRNIFTRDRKKHNPTSPRVPKGYKVLRAWRCENSKYWREYGVRRAELHKDRVDVGPDGDEFVEYSMKSTAAWISKAGKEADRLQADCNEWYLFHGTDAKAAKSICSSDFQMKLAGGSTGTLYGRGAYFAESITKADEYATPNKDGEHAVLLCRVLGGRVRYIDEDEPDPEDCVHSCIKGPFDCILGDREKLKGTFREVVIYDSENVYAEYIIYYKRKH